MHTPALRSKGKLSVLHSHIKENSRNINVVFTDELLKKYRLFHCGCDHYVFFCVRLRVRVSIQRGNGGV